MNKATLFVQQAGRAVPPCMNDHLDTYDKKCYNVIIYPYQPAMKPIIFASLLLALTAHASTLTPLNNGQCATLSRNSHYLFLIPSQGVVNFYGEHFYLTKNGDPTPLALTKGHDGDTSMSYHFLEVNKSDSTNLYELTTTHQPTQLCFVSDE